MSEVDARLKILIVEDYPQHARIFELLLTQMGHEVCATRDYASALTEMKKRQPHVVISDLKMSGVDGFEVARRFRADGSNTDLIMVAHTAMGEAYRQAALDAGYDYFLPKPTDMDALKSLIGTIAGRVQRRPEADG